MTRSVLLFTLALVGCVATPIPDPPSLDMLFVTPTSVGPAVEIAGLAGTVEPRAIVAGVNLDATDPFARAAANAGGAFSLTVLGFPGDVVRLHVEVDGARSEPIDFVAAGGTPAPLVPPLEGCLDVVSATAIGDVAVGSTRTITIPISNACGAAVTIDPIALRAPAAGLSVRTAALTIPDGSNANLEIDVAPTAAGAIEEVVLLNVTAPEVGRRAITLYGTAR